MSETKRYRTSRFVHAFEKDGMCALYNSLMIKPVYVDPSLVPAIRAFGNGATLEEVFAGVEPRHGKTLRELLPVLDETKILVSADGTDEEILAYFQKRFLGKPYVQIVYFILTDACNFGCAYCFIKNRVPLGHRQAQMSVDTARRGIEMFTRLTNLYPEHAGDEKTVVFYGGEPLINVETLRFVLEEVRGRKKDGRFPAKTELSMVTNGTLATSEIAELLREHDVSVAISIDGDQAATDSARRYVNGSSVFADVVRGFDLMREAGVNVGISCTLNQQSVDDFETTLRTLIERFGVDSLGFNIVLDSDGYSVGPDYAERAAAAILRGFETFRRNGVYEDRVMRKINSFVKAELYPFDCGATGGGQIVIAPDGQVGICHGYLGSRKYFPTNVNDANFNPSTDPVFLEWSRRSPFGMEACRDCPALGICGGGCPLNADFETGSIWGLDGRFCVHAKKTLEWLIWDLFAQMNRGKDGHKT